MTSYGEYVGVHDISYVHYLSSKPLFRKEDYQVNTKVIWIDHEDVYEGVIESLHDSTATIRDIKKLMPLDHKVRIPYWRIPEGRKSDEETTSPVIHTIIGDDLD